MNKPMIFSFFSGFGFLDLGFETSGYEIVYVNEIRERFTKGYMHSRKVMGISTPKYGYGNFCITEFLNDPDKYELLESHIQNIRDAGKIVGFIGGPPCPDFSFGGKNKGKEGEKGRLSGTYINIINKLRPDFFLFENVKGLWQTEKHRKFYEELKGSLNSYELTEKLINAIEYGVPQVRERIILIGFNKIILDEHNFASNINEVFPWDKYKIYNNEKTLNQEWATTDTFEVNSSRPFQNSVPKDLTVQHWFDQNDVENHPNSKDHFIPRSAKDSFKQIKEGDDSGKSSKRLHRWRYSPTAAYGNNEVHLHPYKIRRLSAAESLAIQSLPKEFELPTDLTLTDMFKGIGNGVPYLAAKGLANSIRDFIVLLNDKND